MFNKKLCLRYIVGAVKKSKIVVNWAYANAFSQKEISIEFAS